MNQNYICFDNFFQKMTDLESPRKNNDCYFYYYSTCTKGDSCTFRHEPSALGCETTCSFWKEGKCVNVHCNFRHMELRKNRKTIQCYWETQPSGCKKPHCPFLHSSPKSSDGETSTLKIGAVKADDLCNKVGRTDDAHFGSPVVDPLVVRFEEESDNESAPTQSPAKTQRVVKTLEDIKLEQIQAESAAYYSYPDPMEAVFENSPETAEFLRNRIIKRMKSESAKEKEVDLTKVNVLSLDEIRKRKQKFAPSLNFSKAKKPKLNPKVEVKPSELKVKTLDEIRAERAKRFSEAVVQKPEEVSQRPRKKILLRKNINFTSEMEVTSTSVNDEAEDLPRSSEVGNEDATKYAKQTDADDISMIQEESQDIKHPVNASSCDKTDKDCSLKLDDFLLGEDDFDTSPIHLEAEEDILKDIDNLLNE